MRILQLVQKSIETDILSAEQEMEEAINNREISVSDRVDLIKEKLEVIMNSQLKQAKWLDYATNLLQINNNEEKQNENE